MKKRDSGFTLAELLIVVAIIALLVAIAIPVFTSQLEKARQATDLANIRSAYAAASEKVISIGTEQSANAGVMKHTGTFSKLSDARIGNLDLKEDDGAAEAIVRGYPVNVIVASDGTVRLSFEFTGSRLLGTTLTEEQLVGYQQISGFLNFEGVEGNKLKTSFTSITGVDTTSPRDPIVGQYGKASAVYYWNSPVSTYFKWDGESWYSSAGVGSPWLLCS